MSTDDSQPTALERLAISRQRLRESMRPDPQSPDQQGSDEPPAWLNALKGIPGIAVVVEAVQSWWNQHPMRVASLVAADASKTFLRPIIQRNPIALVVGAVVVGGLLAWMRPWRGLLKPAIFAGLVPHLVSRLVANVPTESWMSAFATFSRPNARHASDQAAAAPEAAATATPQPTAAQRSAEAQPPPERQPAAAATVQPAATQRPDQRPDTSTVTSPAH
jgi:hypothetical protein